MTPQADLGRLVTELRQLRDGGHACSVESVQRQNIIGGQDWQYIAPLITRAITVLEATQQRQEPQTDTHIRFEIEITPDMIEAGVNEIRANYFALESAQSDLYATIVCSIYRLMTELRPGFHHLSLEIPPVDP